MALYHGATVASARDIYFDSSSICELYIEEHLLYDITRIQQINDCEPLMLGHCRFTLGHYSYGVVGLLVIR